MTFYEKTLKEFKKNREIFLCHGSKTFEQKWMYKTNRMKIARKAKKFLKAIDKMQYHSNPTNSGCELFYQTRYRRQLRLRFLQWCIQNNLDL